MFNLFSYTVICKCSWVGVPASLIFSSSKALQNSALAPQATMPKLPSPFRETLRGLVLSSDDKSKTLALSKAWFGMFVNSASQQVAGMVGWHCRLALEFAENVCMCLIGWCSNFCCSETLGPGGFVRFTHTHTHERVRWQGFFKWNHSSTPLSFTSMQTNPLKNEQGVSLHKNT